MTRLGVTNCVTLLYHTRTLHLKGVHVLITMHVIYVGTLAAFERVLYDTWEVIVLDATRTDTNKFMGCTDSKIFPDKKFLNSRDDQSKKFWTTSQKTKNQLF